MFNDWIVGATNSVPAAGALTMFAINQSDASKKFELQPVRRRPDRSRADQLFATAARRTTRQSSWAGMSLEADPENGLFYGVETLARKVAAFKLTDTGIDDRCGRRTRPPRSGPR